MNPPPAKAGVEGCFPIIRNPTPGTLRAIIRQARYIAMEELHPYFYR